MARNVEVKARIDSVAALLARVRPLADGEPQLILQDDSYFDCRDGRLKLRMLDSGDAELIHYRRPDREAAKLSDYVRVPVADPDALREALLRALGGIARVRKERTLLLIGQTRVHLDRVEGLGEFLELEVVLREGQSVDAGTAVADALLRQLGIGAEQLVATGYLELLSSKAGA
jgi:adenylate cyclase